MADFARSSQNLTTPSLPAVTALFRSWLAARHVVPACAFFFCAEVDKVVWSKYVKESSEDMAAQ